MPWNTVVLLVSPQARPEFQPPHIRSTASKVARNPAPTIQIRLTLIGHGQLGRSLRSTTTPDIANTWHSTYPRFEKIRIFSAPEASDAKVNSRRMFNTASSVIALGGTCFRFSLPSHLMVIPSCEMP